ncbi:acyl-CoA thioesterase [Haloglycomyces albus]|uniref:acyl-CoA thioesterase n=1 Tax=Haloglycomyces albus TaxID=526067 RepID=UPI00046CB8B4|nr:thioesterase family protein [Haloglycomyces albus]
MARFTTDITLRWSDMDKFGHVNNSVYSTLFEEARVAAMFTAAAKEGITSFEEGIVVARHETDFLLPVVYGQRTRMETWIDRIGNSSFTFAYDLLADGKVAARAKTTMVLLDPEAERPRRVTDVEKEFLSRWTE